MRDTHGSKAVAKNHGKNLNGVVAELRPVSRRQRLSAQELVVKYRQLPRVSYELIQQEADEFFGTQDRIGNSGDGLEPVA